MTEPGWKRDAFIPQPWASDGTAVSAVLLRHLWEPLEFQKISFDGDKNGGLERGKGGKANKQIMGARREALREERGNALTGFLMAFPRNETGPAACDFRRGPVGGAAGAARRPGEHAAEPRRAQGPPMPPWRHASSGQPTTPVRPGQVTPPQHSPPGWGSAAWNCDPLGIDSSQLNSAFSSTFQTVEWKHQVFLLVRLLWALRSDPFPPFPPAPSARTLVPTWAFCVGVGVPGAPGPVASGSCPAMASEQAGCELACPFPTQQSFVHRPWVGHEATTGLKDDFVPRVDAFKKVADRGAVNRQRWRAEHEHQGTLWKRDTEPGCSTGKTTVPAPYSGQPHPFQPQFAAASFPWLSSPQEPSMAPHHLFNKTILLFKN